MPPTMPPLMPHQIPMKDFILTHPFCGIWLGVGGSKTRLTLHALSEIRPTGHILVIAPLAIARSVWIAEIEKWGFGIRTKSLIVNERDKKLDRDKRKALYKEIPTAPPTMYFINKDLIADLADSMPVEDGVLTWPFPTVVIDEAQEFKSPNAVRFLRLAEMRPAITRMIQLSGTPSPQALTLDSPVLTPTGWKPMGEMRVGDHVIGSDGMPTEVIGVWPQGKKPILRVTFSDRSFVDCTENHLWSVNSKSRRAKGLRPLVIETSELTQARSRTRATAKEVGLRNSNGDPRWAIPTVKPIEMRSADVPLDPYLLGVLLGDGHIGSTISFTTPDDEIRRSVEDALPAGLQLTECTSADNGCARSYYITSGKKGGSLPGKKRGPAPNSAKVVLQALGLVGKRAWEKFIPDVYLWNDQATRLSILQGLCDTDGSSKAGHGSTSHFTTTSPQLAEDVTMLIRSLGGYATQQTVECPYPRLMPTGAYSVPRPLHVLTFGMPMNPFRLSRKAANWKPRWRVKERTITSIEPMGSALAQCITVAADDGLFVTKDFIVTHNSLADVWSQVFLLDGGRALGDNFLQFRSDYFAADKVINGRPVSWKPKPGAEEAIHARIAHLVASAEAKTLPLPPVSYRTMPVDLPDEASEAYLRFRRDKVIELATPDPEDPDTMVITADNAAILRGKLLQFASGTLYTGEDHDKEFSLVHEAKLKALAQIVRAQNGAPLLVAYRYRTDRQIIPAYLASLGFRAEVLDGSREMIRRWNAGQIPVMLLQPASYRHGLNLQHGGCHLAWYTLPDSLEHWIQTVGRLRRIGQPNPVTITSIVTRGTVDERQPALLSRKRITQDALLEAVRIETRDDLAALNAKTTVLA